MAKKKAKERPALAEVKDCMDCLGPFFGMAFSVEDYDERGKTRGSRLVCRSCENEYR